MRLKSIRISQKIMILVAGLAAGFMAIGVVYFIQLDKQSKESRQRNAIQALQHDLLNARDSVQPTGMVEVGDLADARASASGLLKKNTLLSRWVELKTFETVTNHFVVATQNYVDANQSLMAVLKRLESSAIDVDQALSSQQTVGDLQSRVADFLRWQETRRQLDESIQSAGASDDSTVIALKGDWDQIKQEYETSLQAYAAAHIRWGTVVNDALLWSNGLLLDLERQAASTRNVMGIVFIVLVTCIVSITAAAVYMLYKSIVFPMMHMQAIIRKVSRGRLDARVAFISDDELGDLAKAFNQLLDDKIQSLDKQAKENDQLNHSIISLIRSVGAIARKDLTIKVPVSADITGTVSDAVNLLTSETAKTLAKVRQISTQVDGVADSLQEQSAMVIKVAEEERKQVVTTAKVLDISAKAMGAISEKAGEADRLAKGAISTTQAAHSSVDQVVQSVLMIRETIAETEKRIKRLGDRSLEISSIVNLINTISERTHILALNASMHAASAGEAGRGFGVVADEVQRLAENAREATADIAAMVNNIRVETGEVVTVMNKLISEVAGGTRVAEVAGKQMQDTNTVTTELVAVVSWMAARAIEQAELTQKVRDRAIIIRNFTEKTAQQLQKQKTYTESLRSQSAELVSQVSLFKLPDALWAATIDVEPASIESKAG